MKSTIKIFMTAVFGLLLLHGCSNDDSGNPFVASASDITITIDENPANGFAIGTVTTNITGTIAYTITSQSVPNALTIDTSTGAVTVNDSSLFDFETNASLSAVISVTNSTDTATAAVTITLNDIDDIASFLSTSSAAYSAAATGDWVIITEAEYNALAASLNQVTKGGLGDTEYDAGPTGGTFGAYTIANVDGPTLPVGSYIFAAKYNLWTAAAVNVKLKQSSTSVSAGYADVGGVMTGGDAGNNYLVLKGSDSATTAIGFLAVFEDTGQMGFASIAGNSIQFGNGDLNDLPSTQNNSVVFFQTLSSTQKQWD